jgi:hypothetical protein
VSVDQDSSVNLQLPGNDPDGDALQYTITGPPAHGVLIVQVVTGAATTTFPAGGPIFAYKVTDGQCESAEAIVITVICGG